MDFRRNQGERDSEKRRRERQKHSWWDSFGNKGVNEFYGHTPGAHPRDLKPNRNAGYNLFSSFDGSLHMHIKPTGDNCPIFGTPKSENHWQQLG